MATVTDLNVVEVFWKREEGGRARVREKERARTHARERARECENVRGEGSFWKGEFFLSNQLRFLYVVVNAPSYALFRLATYPLHAAPLRVPSPYILFLGI